MKENVLDVLMYLFENHMEDGNQSEDRDAMQGNLLEAGFPPAEISKAFDWLDGLVEFGAVAEPKSGTGRAFRLFSADEERRLGPECRGFLLFLEDAGILDTTRRELVIDRVMALDESETELDDLKWVTLMVLLNQPGQEEAYSWMETLIIESHSGMKH